MPIEKDILDRTPMRDELRSGESIIVKDEYGEAYEATNIDGTVYRTPLFREDEDFKFGNTIFQSNEGGEGITSGGSGSIAVNPGNTTFTVLDPQGAARVILGQTTDDPKYGIRIQDHSGTVLAGMEGDAGATTATIAGWNINSGYLEKDGTRLNAGSHNGYFGVNATAYDAEDGIWLGEVSTGVYKFSIKNADSSKYLRYTDSAFEIATGNFSVDASGDITANGGTVAGWIIGTNLFKSAASGARIELNKALNRVSIFDASSEKIVMGYLSGVRKNAQHDGNNVWKQASSPTAPGGNTSLTLFTVHTDDIANNESETAFKDGGLVGMTVTMCNSSGSIVSSTVSGTITANTFNTIQITLNISTSSTSYSAGNDHFYLTYSSAHYGFWAAKGDTLAIDGDMSYESGDWMIEGDASIKIFNGAGTEVIRLGTHNGDKGLFVGNLGDDDTVTGYFANDVARIGLNTAENVIIDGTSMKFRNNGTTYAELSTSTWTLGEAVNNHVKITTSAIEMFNADSKRVVHISGTGDGTVTIGNTTDSNHDHSELTDGNLIFNHYQSSDKHQLPYMFAQYVDESLLNLGSANTFSGLNLANMPANVNYDIIFIPKLLQYYRQAATGNDQAMGFEINAKSSSGFTPVVKIYDGTISSTSVTDTSWTDSSLTLDTNHNAAYYAYNTAIDTDAAYNVNTDPLSGPEVNKLTITLVCANLDARASDFTFLVRLGQRDTHYPTKFLSSGYKEYTHIVSVMGGDVDQTVTLTQTWSSTDGVYDALFLFSVDWHGDSRAHGSSTVAVTNCIYESIPSYTEITGTNKCAALVVGF